MLHHNIKIIMELSHNQLRHLLFRYPKFDSSYETVSQKGDLHNYTFCIGIPTGKKHIVWNTYYNDKDISYIFELNREKQISKGKILKNYSINPFSLGTILYGTMYENEELEKNVFIIDDIYYYKGIYLKNVPFLNKLSYIKEYIMYISNIEHSCIFALPYMWETKIENTNELLFNISDKIKEDVGYDIHHLQYRSPNFVVPYINVLSKKKIDLNPNTHLETLTLTYYKIKYNMDLNRPQYKYNTIFLIKADLQNDIYHLFAYGSKKQLTYYNIAFIPDYKTSVMMNNVFRKIKENKNLDYIEESDDEEEFQNTSVDKYVDINKIVPFECKFSRKFKRWLPISQVGENNKIVHIGKLVRNYIGI